MNWVVADLLMFVCSVAVYVPVRKAALDQLTTQFNNLAMFAIPFVIFLVGGIASGSDFGLTWHQTLEIIGTAVVFSYAGNMMSLRSIQVAPNPGYSLVLSKSYVVFTTIWALVFLNATLGWLAGIAIVLIVACSAVIMVNRKASSDAGSKKWIPLAIGAFFCWGFLSLMGKHLTSHGVPTIVFLTYIFGIVTLCISFEMSRARDGVKQIKAHVPLFVAIGIPSVGFNYFNFYAIKIAPNVGYVNATNAASIGAVTLLAALIFKDELTRQKLAGVFGVLVGLLLLFLN